MQSGFLAEYASFLRNLIKMNVGDVPDPERPLDGHHIVVDAGNGAGGFIATEVLQPLGANIEGTERTETCCAKRIAPKAPPWWWFIILVLRARFPPVCGSLLYTEASGLN